MKLFSLFPSLIFFSSLFFLKWTERDRFSNFTFPPFDCNFPSLYFVYFSVHFMYFFLLCLKCQINGIISLNTRKKYIFFYFISISVCVCVCFLIFANNVLQSISYTSTACLSTLSSHLWFQAISLSSNGEIVIHTRALGVNWKKKKIEKSPLGQVELWVNNCWTLGSYLTSNGDSTKTKKKTERIFSLIFLLQLTSKWQLRFCFAHSHENKKKGMRGRLELQAKNHSVCSLKALNSESY